MLDLYQAALMFNANPGHLRRQRKPDPWDWEALPRAAAPSRLLRLLRFRRALERRPVGPE